MPGTYDGMAAADAAWSALGTPRTPHGRPRGSGGLTQAQINDQATQVALETQHAAALTLVRLATRAPATPDGPSPYRHVLNMWEMLGIDVEQVVSRIRGDRRSTAGGVTPDDTQTDDTQTDDVVRDDKSADASGDTPVEPTPEFTEHCRVCARLLIPLPYAIPNMARRKHSDGLCFPDAKKIRQKKNEAETAKALKRPTPPVSVQLGEGAAA
jgi:hypothetical protein